MACRSDATLSRHRFLRTVGPWNGCGFRSCLIGSRSSLMWPKMTKLHSIIKSETNHEKPNSADNCLKVICFYYCWKRDTPNITIYQLWKAANLTSGAFHVHVSIKLITQQLYTQLS